MRQYGNPSHAITVKPAMPWPSRILTTQACELPIKVLGRKFDFEEKDIGTSVIR